MGVLHDIRCRTCESEVHDVLIRNGEFPRCPKDRRHGAMTWIPRGFRTDVFGSPKMDEINGTGEYSSNRELERRMARDGWEPAGDKVGGARNESHLNLGKKFSFSGQRNRS